MVLSRDWRTTRWRVGAGILPLLIADITFTETTQAGLSDSLDFTFQNLDGNGGTLARAFFPDDVNPARIAGDVQFDRAESWEVGNAQGNRGFDFLHVAVHEIGHALGLPHDTAFGSVLNATVSPNEEFVELGQSDIDAILELYAPVQPEPVSTPPVVDPDPVEPENPVVDTPETQTPDSQTPTGTEDETDPGEGEDDETEDIDPAEEFRQRFQRFINQWLRRLRQFGFRFRFR